MKRILILALFSTVLIAGSVSCATSSSPKTTQGSVAVPGSAPASTSADVPADSGTPAQKHSYTLTTEVSPSKSGYIIPSIGVYKPGEVVTLTSEPSSGYEFFSWSGDASGIEPEIQITMDSDKKIIAKFTDIRDPVISDIEVLDITDTTAKITWKTDEEATSKVRYGTTTNYQSTSPHDDKLVSEHTITLTELASDATYHFRVESTDRSGNGITSERDSTFTTKTVRECTYSVINSVAVFGKAIYTLDYSITNNSSQMIYINRVVIYDEQGTTKYTVNEASIHETVPEGKLLPGDTYYSSLNFDPTLLVGNVNGWHIGCYCIDTKGNTFTIEGYLP